MKEIKVGKLICIWLGVQLIVSMVTLDYFDGDLGRVLGLVIAQIITLAILLKVGRVNKELVMNRIADFKEKFRFKEILGIVLMQILIGIALSNIISASMYILNPEYAIEIMQKEIFSTDTVYQLLLGFVGATIMAPLLEEIMFRRILFNRFKGKIGILGGAILSSVLFGLLHLELAMVGAMVFGLTCCILYRKYKNILIPISMHFLNNFIAMCVSLIFTIVDKIMGTSEVVDYTMTASDIRFSMILGVVLLTISMIMFGRFIYKNKMYLKNEENIKTLSL